MQDVRLLEFNSLKAQFDDYQPGDVVNLRPHNLKTQIELFFEIFQDHPLNLNPDDIISIQEIHNGIFK